eukprot:scaffold4722_cov103-Isochrysis_galbana.AAC.3
MMWGVGCGCRRWERGLAVGRWRGGEGKGTDGRKALQLSAVALASKLARYAYTHSRYSLYLYDSAAYSQSLNRPINHINQYSSSYSTYARAGAATPYNLISNFDSGQCACVRCRCVLPPLAVPALAGYTAFVLRDNSGGAAYAAHAHQIRPPPTRRQSSRRCCSPPGPALARAISRAAGPRHHRTFAHKCYRQTSETALVGRRPATRDRRLAFYGQSPCAYGRRPFRWSVKKLGLRCGCNTRPESSRQAAPRHPRPTSLWM